jgi:hypothetical protein
MTVSLLPNHISRWWRCERWEESETEPKKYNRAKLGDTDTQKNTDGTNKMSTESIMEAEDTGQQTQARKTQGEVILNPH